MKKLCCASFVLAFAFSWTADASSICDIRLPVNAKPHEKHAVHKDPNSKFNNMDEKAAKKIR